MISSGIMSSIKGINAISICSSVLNPRTSADSLPKDIKVDSTELVISLFVCWVQ